MYLGVASRNYRNPMEKAKKNSTAQIWQILSSGAWCKHTVCKHMQTFVKRSGGRRHVAFYHRWIVPLEVWQQVPNLSMQSTSNVQNVQNFEMPLAWQIKPAFPDSLQFWNLAMFDMLIWQCRSGYAVIMPGHQKTFKGGDTLVTISSSLISWTAALPHTLNVNFFC